MKITRENLKNIVREAMVEENAYQEFFKKALEKTGKSIPNMSDEEKKAFFNKIDSAWKGKGEKNEGNAFGAAVSQAKKDGDDSFKVDGEEYKVETTGKGPRINSDAKANERFGRGAGVGPTFGSADESEEDLDEEAVVVSKRTPEGNIVSKLKEELTDAQKKLPPALQKAIAKKDGKDESVDESINEAEIRWGAVDNAIIKYIKYNVKVLEKPIKARDEDGTKKMLKAFIGGLVNAQRSLKLESVNEGKFKVDDLVYNKRTKTIGIVRMGDDKYGEVKTDADGNVSVDELEKYNPIKFKHQTKAKVAPSTEKEVNSRGLFNPFKMESKVNEGKKRFNTKYGVGKSKYVVNYHDGVKKHKDGSDFFDVQIFKNQKDLEAFKKALLQKGFVAESVVNEDANMNKKVKAFLDKGLRDLTKGKPNHQFAVMHVLMGALTDANFHSEAKKVPSIFTRAKYEGDPRGEKDVIGIYEEMGENVASICKWDGKDIVDAIGFYVSMTIGRPVGEKVEKLVESINETIYLLNNKK